MNRVQFWIINAPAMVLGLLGLWMVLTAEAEGLHMRLPLGQGNKALADRVDLSGQFQAFAAQPGPDWGSWPQFRGPQADNIARGQPRLARTWPAGGPPEVWRLELGDGHAGAAVADGRVYIMDYNEAAQRDVLRCFSLADASELWQRSYPVVIKRNHGISRTVPALQAGKVVAMGPKCHVICCDARSGDFAWGVDLVREHGAKVPLWYTAQCPLIDGETVVLAPAGPKALLVGLDLHRGVERWRTPNPEGWQMSHASVLLTTLAGVRQYVYVAIGGLAGICAEPGREGELLWTSTAWNLSVVAPTPIALGADRLLLTAGYGAGAVLLQVRHDPPTWSVTVEQQLPVDRFACEQQTPIVDHDRVYTIMPKDAGGLRGQLICTDGKGTLLWGSGPKLRFGLGPFLLVANDDQRLMLVLDDRGELSLIDVAGGQGQLLAQERIIKGRDAWAPLALVGGRLLMRDDHTMLCLDLREK